MARTPPAGPWAAAGATGSGPGRLRADAERNRRAILAAATDAVTEHGLGVSVEQIARRAGVGSATLYRRFPTRAGLLDAAVRQLLSSYADLVERALESPDPWTGFSELLRALCERQARDAGLRELLTLHTWPPSALDERGRRAVMAMEEVVERARVAGALRAGFVVEDVRMLLVANAGIVNAGGTDEVWRRHTEYLIEAFRSP